MKERLVALLPTARKALWMFAHSKRDPDLAGIREEAGLARLPEDERETWRVFWADLDAATGRNPRAAREMAERQGFEPWVTLRPHRFSKPARFTRDASIWALSGFGRSPVSPVVSPKSRPARR